MARQDECTSCLFLVNMTQVLETVVWSLTIQSMKYVVIYKEKVIFIMMWHLIILLISNHVFRNEFRISALGLVLELKFFLEC